MPLVASILTLLLYVGLRSVAVTIWGVTVSALIVGIAGTVIVWIVAALVYSPAVTPRAANSGVYSEIYQRYRRLESLCQQLSRQASQEAASSGATHSETAANASESGSVG